MRALVVGCLVAACGGSGGVPPDAAPVVPDAALPAIDAAPDPAADLFDPTQIREIRIELAPASYAAIDAEAVPGEPACRNSVWERAYHAGNVVYDGQRFDGAGVRVKGGCGTSRHLDQKASFLVNLAWDDPDVAGCPEERRLSGQKHLTLNNLVQDATYLHEALGYGLLRQLGAPAPRSAYVHVYLNDEYVGLYLLLETIDRQFLKRTYDDGGDGMMYENGRPYCDLLAGNGGADGCFTREFLPGPCNDPDRDDDPRDWTLLDDLIADVDALPEGEGFLAAFGALYDADEFLTTWATTAAIRHADTYVVSSINNYRMYHHPDDGRWSLIQAGFDWSFWTTPIISLWEDDGVLARKCLVDDACAAAFAAAVRVAQAAIADDAFAARAEALHDQIWPLIQADPRREFVYDGEPYTTDADFLGAYTRMMAWLPGRAAELDAELAERGY